MANVDITSVLKERDAKVKEVINPKKVGKTKIMYRGNDGSYIFRNYFPVKLNVFAVKKSDGERFLIDLAGVIKKNENDLIKKQTYVQTVVKKIAKLDFMTKESMSNGDTAYRNISLIWSNKHPSFQLTNIKDGEEKNGIHLFTSEVIQFMKYINEEEKIMDRETLEVSTIKRKLDDNDFF